MCRTQVYNALIKLASYGLLRRGHGWAELDDRTLDEVADELQIDDVIDHRRSLHRAERASWHELLNLWSGDTSPDCPVAERVPADPWTPNEHAEYLAAVLAGGPPPMSDHDLAHLIEPDPVEAGALMILAATLGARPLIDTCSY